MYSSYRKMWYCKIRTRHYIQHRTFRKLYLLRIISLKAQEVYLGFLCTVPISQIFSKLFLLVRTWSLFRVNNRWFLFVFQTFLHGFPHQPTAVAFDPIQRVLAIGTKNGSLRLYPFSNSNFKRILSCIARRNPVFNILSYVTILVLCTDLRLYKNARTQNHRKGNQFDVFLLWARKINAREISKKTKFSGNSAIVRLTKSGGKFCCFSALRSYSIFALNVCARLYTRPYIVYIKWKYLVYRFWTATKNFPLLFTIKHRRPDFSSAPVWVSRRKKRNH